MDPVPVRYSALCLTHRCNLRCAYCYAEAAPGTRMSAETARGAVDFLARVGPDRSTVTFFGGEPLTELSLIQDIVAYAQRTYPRRFQFRMSTNGTLLEPGTIDWLEKNEVYFVISLDGDQRQHDANRRLVGGQGSYTKAVRHLPRVLQANPYTMAVSVIAPNTAQDLARGVVDLFAQGFRYVLQTLDYAAPWSSADLGGLKKGYVALAAWYADALRSGRKVYYSPFDERIKTWAQRPYRRGEVCDLANSQIAIAASGRIYPCVQFIGGDGEEDRTRSIGDVFEGFLPERRRWFVEENHAERPTCRGCALEGRCANWCGCVNWRTTGDLKTIPPVLCEHERMLMPIVDQMASALWRQRVELFRRKFYEPTYPVSSYLEDCRAGQGGGRC